MPAKQRTFDWERLSLRRMLEELRLPDVPGVSGDTARAVLLAIYDQDQGRPCWPGQQRLAARAGVGDRQIRRVLQVLENRFGLLATYRAKPADSATAATLTHYVIVWTDVAIQLQRAAGQSCPVATDPCPVGQNPCPVGQQPDNIYARLKEKDYGKGQEKELTSTSTCSVTSDVSFDTRLPDAAASRTSADRTEWAAVEDLLKLHGIYVRGHLVRYWQGAGRDVESVLSEIYECLRVVSAPINRERLHTPKAALVARLQTGTWPAEVALDIERAERRDQADLSRTQRSRWSSALHSAWLDQRRQTPRGELVDDAAVVDIAVTRYGVPREFAEKERGLA